MQQRDITAIEYRAPPSGVCYRYPGRTLRCLHWIRDGVGIYLQALQPRWSFAVRPEHFDYSGEGRGNDQNI